MYDIRNLFLFRTLSDAETEALLHFPTENASFEKGDIIYDGAHFRRALGVFLVGKGYAGDGDAVKTVFSEGDVFGAAALFGAGEVYVSRIAAKTACRVLFLPEETLRAMMEASPVCAVNYVTFLSERIRFLNEKIAQYTGNSASARLYRLLCDRADADGCIENANLSALAGLSGMGRTSVYRALAELIENGSVTRENKNIYIRRTSL